MAPLGFSALSVFCLGSRVLCGQGMPTATLSGSVVSEGGQPIPGVVVRLESSSLQGIRKLVTSGTGDYFLTLLPPGDYSVTFSLEGMESARRKVSLAAAGTVRLDLVMRPAAVRESVTVSGETGNSNLETPQVAANYKKDLVDRLPIDRSLRSVVLLAPGVTENGPRGNLGSANERPALMISGAPSFENLFLVNGVVVNENLRGQPQDLFIEDAVQETVVQTGAITAEYGHFTGGVVNVITKSGGNELHGSLRTTFTNDRWTANNPYARDRGSDNRVDDVSETYEATLGGPVWRDRIWAFAAGRQASLSDSRTTQPTPLPGDIDPTPIAYVHGTDERRLEGKLTAAVSQRHNLVASYIDVDADETNFAFNINILDTASLVSRRLPHSLLALNYNAVLSDRVFLEAQFSRRRFSTAQEEEVQSDRIRGTRIFDLLRSRAGYNSPQTPLRASTPYDNESWLLKASYFLPTKSLGSHDLRLGYEFFRESSRSNNYASGSDYWIAEPAAIIRGTQIFPSFRPGVTGISWNPVLELSRGMNLDTHSGFINDRIDWNRRWSFNLGLRYDKNADEDGRGDSISRAASWSPRLAVRFDPGGHGRVELHAGYARYVDKFPTSIVNTVSPAGRPTSFGWQYRGPCVNCDPFAPTGQLLSTEEALSVLFAWFDSIGGTGAPPTAPGVFPGPFVRIGPGGLRSPSVREYSFGAGLALGSRGYIRTDLLYRDFDDFPLRRIDRSTGPSAPDQFGNVFDVEEIESSNRLDRRYTGLQTQFSSRFGSRLSVGGSYTWSRLTGNFAAESRNNAGILSDVASYPEYRQERWNYPTGYLGSRGNPQQAAVDQRHRARVWLGYELSTRVGDLSVALLESYDSGLPYEAVGPIDLRPGYVANPGYRTPPTTSVLYFFSEPAAFRTEDITRTDLAVRFAVPIRGKVELFIRPEILNLFNERGVVAVDATVFTAANATGLLAFDPFDAAPVRGARDVSAPAANYDLGPNFGQPTSAAGYQVPRTFRASIGLTF